MHGAANDFIVVDDRALTFPAHDSAWLQAIMKRHTGIGSEGVLLIQPSNTVDFRMRFFNPDGGEVDMCGNGARCIARLAHELKVAPAFMKFETGAGVVGAEILGDQVRLTMTTPKDWRLGRRLTAAGRELAYDFVNSGVPHAVVRVDYLAGLDVQTLGAAVRYHRDFAPKGTNANFISVAGPDTVRLRTYERGAWRWKRQPAGPASWRRVCRRAHRPGQAAGQGDPGQWRYVGSGFPPDRGRPLKGSPSGQPPMCFRASWFIGSNQ